jgi:hypothetical protein
MSARAAKRELADALRGEPWERWSTRSVVWAAGHLRRFTATYPEAMAGSDLSVRRFDRLRRQLPIVDEQSETRQSRNRRINILERLEAAAYLWEHAGEEPHPDAS